MVWPEPVAAAAEERLALLALDLLVPVPEPFDSMLACVSSCKPLPPVAARGLGCRLGDDAVDLGVVEQNETPESCSSPTGMIPVGSGGGSSAAVPASGCAVDLDCDDSVLCAVEAAPPPPPPPKKPPLKKALVLGAEATLRRNRAAPPPFCEELPEGLLAFLVCFDCSLLLWWWLVVRGAPRCERDKLRNFSALVPPLDDDGGEDGLTTCDDAAEDDG